MKQVLLTDPLSNAKTVCHLCGKAHLHGPFDHEKQLRINREHRWQRIKGNIVYILFPLAFLGLITLGALMGPHEQPLTPEEQREEQKEEQIKTERLSKIDAALDALQNERDEIDPPVEYEPDPPDYP